MDKKWGQFTDQVAEREHLVLQGDPQPTPSYTLLTIPLGSRFHQGGKYKLRLQQSRNTGWKALVMRNSIYRASYVSRSPKERQASSLTKNMLPELLHFVLAVP